MVQEATHFQEGDAGVLRALVVCATAAPASAGAMEEVARAVDLLRGAKHPCIFAGWGYGRPDMAEGSNAVARDITEAAVIANGLLPPASESDHVR